MVQELYVHMHISFFDLKVFLIFVNTALTRAVFRDGYSGGFVRTCVITAAGAKRKSYTIDVEYDELKLSVKQQRNQPLLKD